MIEDESENNSSVDINVNKRQLNKSVEDNEDASSNSLKVFNVFEEFCNRQSRCDSPAESEQIESDIESVNSSLVDNDSSNISKRKKRIRESSPANNLIKMKSKKKANVTTEMASNSLVAESNEGTIDRSCASIVNVSEREEDQNNDLLIDNISESDIIRELKKENENLKQRLHQLLKIGKQQVMTKQDSVGEASTGVKMRNRFEALEKQSMLENEINMETEHEQQPCDNFIKVLKKRNTKYRAHKEDDVAETQQMAAGAPSCDAPLSISREPSPALSTATALN